EERLTVAALLRQHTVVTDPAQSGEPDLVEVPGSVCPVGPGRRGGMCCPARGQRVLATRRALCPGCLIAHSLPPAMPGPPGWRRRYRPHRAPAPPTRP